MAETVDDLTIQYEEEGKVLVRELDKRVLTRGAWATILFLYRTRNRQSGEFDPPQVSIRRFQKVRGSYMLRSKFNVSGARQAHQIAETLRQWFPEADPNSATG